MAFGTIYTFNKQHILKTSPCFVTVSFFLPKQAEEVIVGVADNACNKTNEKQQTTTLLGKFLQAGFID
jgi:hypothetical protein